MPSVLLAVNSYFAKPKNFFNAMSIGAYITAFSPKAKEAALRVARCADMAYDWCVGSSFFESTQDFFKEKSVKNGIAVVAYGFATLEFSHTYLKMVDLGKKLTYIQLMGGVSDIAFYALDIREVTKNTKNPFKEKFLTMVANIITLVEVLSVVFALAWSSAFVLSSTTFLVLDATHFVAHFTHYIFYSNAA